MKLPASALAAVLLGSSATARAAAIATDAGRQLQETKIDGDCDDDRRCGLCEGDCDEDSNCEGDMICRQRDDGEKVPGCKLGDDDRPDVDYCYSPPIEEEDEEDEEEDDNEVMIDGESATPDYDATSCGGPVIKRAQECGAASNKLPSKCCPGYKCRGEGAMRCEIDPNASVVGDGGLGANTNNAADEANAADDVVVGAPAEARDPTFAPTTVRLPTFTPSLAPAKITPKPTRQVRATERPTAESEKKPRTWATILTKDKLVRNVVKQENKFMKRAITQETDPFRFTEQPSTMPSSMPSVRPSLRPSQSPSVLPTANPSESPTFAPTKMRKEECKIEMYYERRWCWHDDSMNYDCDRDFRFCAEAEGEWSLEMEECDNSPTTWLVLGPTIRPKDDKNLCWTRRGDNGVRLYPCDEEGKGRWENQRFAGMCMKKPSKITPLADKSFCLTSGHEPRDGEQLKFQECDKVDNSNTHLWVMK